MALGRKTGGRKKGTPNKVTQDLREAIREAFEKAGGVEYLVGLAHSDPKTFGALIGKIVPSEVRAEVDHKGGVTLTVVSGIERTPDEK